MFLYSLNESSLFIEKPLATDLVESRDVLNKIKSTNVDVVLGYTQRFRRRFLIKSDKNVNIQDVILNWTRKINTPNHIKLTIDIDPFSFM